MLLLFLLSLRSDMIIFRVVCFHVFIIIFIVVESMRIEIIPPVKKSLMICFLCWIIVKNIMIPNLC